MTLITAFSSLSFAAFIGCLLGWIYTWHKLREERAMRARLRRTLKAYEQDVRIVTDSQGHQVVSR